jgi:hypothetical protein
LTALVDLIRRHGFAHLLLNVVEDQSAQVQIEQRFQTQSDTFD